LVVVRGVVGSVKSFLHGSSAGVTVEFVLWVPVFMTGLAIVVDSTLMFVEQAHMIRVASETSRLLAVGGITAADAEAYAQLRAFDDHVYSVLVTTDGTDVTTLISVPFADVGVTGVMNLAPGSTISVQVTQRLEEGISL
jgi:Flp pilus assembly protein TadG